MKEISKLATLKDDPQNESLDIMLDAAVVALRKDNPKVAENREHLEEVLDVPTMYKIFDIAGGVQLSGDAVPN